MKVSIVVSLYNEEKVITSFWENIKKELSIINNIQFEILWVNDGSIDGTQNLINSIKKNNSIENIENIPIEFSRNFGHEAAMIAGIDNATGEAIICLDSDEQHPPSNIYDMIKSFKNGYDIVLMERIHRDDNGMLKNLLSSLFYKFINSISSVKLQQNTTDFFLISKQIAHILKTNYRERSRFIRGFIQSIGFNIKTLPFSAPARSFGESNYSLFSLFKLSLNAIFSFSNKPLRISILFSILFILFTSVFSVYTLLMFLFGNTPPSGYTSIILFLSFSFSLLFLTITVLSLYFEKTIEEMRERPIYIIKNKS